MIGREIAPPAQMMLLGRPKFKFLRFQTTVNIRRASCEARGLKPGLLAYPVRRVTSRLM